MAIQGRLKSAENFGFRPLDKGMILNRPSQALPEGAFTRLKNFIAKMDGLFRRPGYQQFAAAEAVPYRHVDYVALWRTNGEQNTYLITEKSIYRTSPISGFTEVSWDLSGTGASVSGSTFEDLAGAFTTSDILPGDIMRIGGNEVEIETILSATQLQLKLPNPIPDGTGYDYTIHRAFGPTDYNLPDWVVFNDVLLLVDGKRPIIQLDPSTDTISYWIDSPAKQPSTGEFIPNCITAFQDRVYVGYIKDAVDGEKRQRIRWSALADPRDFSIPTAFQDLPYVNGALRRLVPLQNTLIAYFDDHVYMGIQTNSPLLPLRFDSVETGGMGLVGPKAVMPYVGGHFFVGQDDIYFLNTQGVERIGTPISRESIRTCQFPYRVYAALDPWNNCAVFGFPEDNEYMTRLWRFNYRTQGWSYDNAATYMIANPIVNASFSWDDLSGTWETLGAAFTTWNTIKTDDPRRFLFIEHEGILWKGSEVDGMDFSVTPIEGLIETMDHDLGLPDSLKTFVRFGLKISSDDFLTQAITFRVSVSINKGRTWKFVGDMTIPIGKDEGYVNFRALGSTLRVRLRTTAVTDSFTINEYVLRGRSHGAELDTSTQS